MKKIFKYIGFTLLALLVLFIVLAFVMPTEHSITLEKTINAPKVMVFNAINDLRAHQEWIPYGDGDETMKIELADKKVGKGASYQWTSETQGDGMYKITESDSDTGISAVVDFGKKQANEKMTLENVDGKTKIDYLFDFESGRFSNVFMPIQKIFMKGMFKNSLENIESLVLNRKDNAEYYGYKIDQEVIPLQYFATKRSEVQEDKVQQFYASNLGSLYSSLQSAGIESNGKPCVLIYNFKPLESKVDLAAGIPLNGEENFEGATLQKIPAGSAVTLDFYGDYKKIWKGHDAIQAYMSDRELVHDWPVIEQYITDPSVEQDPTKWLTEIYYPIGN